MQISEEEYQELLMYKEMANFQGMARKKSGLAYEKYKYEKAFLKFLREEYKLLISPIEKDFQEFYK